MFYAVSWIWSSENSPFLGTWVNTVAGLALTGGAVLRLQIALQQEVGHCASHDEDLDVMPVQGL